MGDRENVLVGFLRVGAHVATQRAGDAELRQLGQSANEVRLNLDSIDGRKPRHNWLDAQFFRPGFVHERRVQVAHLLAFRARGIVLGFRTVLDDLAEVVFGLLCQDGKDPIVGTVGRDFGLGQPRAVHGPEQIILRADGLVEARLFDAAAQRGRGRNGQNRPKPSSSQADRRA